MPQTALGAATDSEAKEAVSMEGLGAVRSALLHPRIAVAITAREAIPIRIVFILIGLDITNDK